MQTSRDLRRSRSGKKPLRFSAWVVVLVAFAALPSCGDADTPDDIPPLVLSSGDDQIELQAFVYCWKDLCLDGFDDPPDFAVTPGEAIEMTFSVSRWVMNGEDPTDGVWQLDPLPEGSDAAVRSITGRGPQGDGAWSVRLVPAG